MATTKHSPAAKRSMKKAVPVASTKKAVARMPKQAASAMNKRGAKPGPVASQRKRNAGAMTMTRTQLYALAQQRDLPGRSKMGRDELAKALGVR